MIYDAVVLAGGEGRRLAGADKPEVQVAGRALLDHALAAVAGARRRVVVGPDASARPGVPRTLEEPPLGGPVAGIDAGLAALGPGGAPTVVVLACDVPRAAALVPRLLAALEAAADVDGAVAVGPDGHQQHLVAAYRRSALTSALDGLRRDGGVRDRAVNRLVAGMGLVTVADPEDLARDVDTWQDVAALEAAPEGSEG